MTFRALGVGACVGAVLATANVYLGLKTGWWDGGGITALLAVYAVLGRSKHPAFSQAENVLAQTLASSAAAMPAAVGVIGAIPALELLEAPLNPWALLPWGWVMGLLGLALAALLRDQMLVKEMLPFPSGVAIAEVAGTLHGAAGRGHGRPLLIGALLGGLIAWLRDGRFALIPASSVLPFRVWGRSAESLTLGVSWSPMLFGLGAMMGPRNGAALAVGAVLAWGVGAPWLLEAGWVQRAEYGSLVGWLLWPGAALMVAGGLTSIAFEWRALLRAAADLRNLEGGRGAWRWLAGAAAGGLVTALLARQLFDLPLLAGAALVGVSVLAGVVCVRVTGEAALAPVGQLAEVVQLSVASVMPGQAATNVGGGALVAGSLVEASQLSESFKVGQLTGVAPRPQLVAAAVGVFVGGAVTLPVYALLTKAHALGSAALPAPGAVPWKAIAQLASGGAHAVPAGAGQAALWAAAAGIALELARRHRRLARLPSPLMLGLAFIVPATTSFALALGSTLVLLLPRSERQVQSGSAGAVAGESLVGIVVAFFSVGGAGQG